MNFFKTLHDYVSYAVLGVALLVIVVFGAWSLIDKIKDGSFWGIFKTKALWISLICVLLFGLLVYLLGTFPSIGRVIEIIILVWVSIIALLKILSFVIGFFSEEIGKSMAQACVYLIWSLWLVFPVLFAELCAYKFFR